MVAQSLVIGIGAQQRLIQRSLGPCIWVMVIAATIVFLVIEFELLPS